MPTPLRALTPRAGSSPGAGTRHWPDVRAPRLAAVWHPGGCSLTAEGRVAQEQMDGKEWEEGMGRYQDSPGAWSGMN